MISLLLGDASLRSGVAVQEIQSNGRGEDEENKHARGLEDGKRDDPVIYLTGGPGAPVTAYVKRFKDHTLLDHRDLYILEQRGIGASDNFCEFFGTRNPQDGDVGTFEESLEAARKAREDCAVNATAAGVDLGGYNTIEAEPEWRQRQPEA